MAKKNDDELIIKAFRWIMEASNEIMSAGGNPVSVLASLSDDVIITMIRNNLIIRHERNLDA